MFFGQNTADDQSLMQTAQDNPAASPKPGFWAGAGTAAAQGFPNAAGGLMLLGNDVASAFPVDKTLNPDYDQQSEDFHAALLDAKNKYQPDPATTGWLGRTLFGITSTVPQVVAGAVAGGPVAGALTLGGAQGNASFANLKYQHVDDATAAGVGVVDAATSAAGALMPGLGSGILSRIGFGAAGNIGTGMFQRGATNEILKAGGYDDMAHQYKTMDGSNIISDAILGGFFGVFSKGHAKELSETPSNVDAALMQKNVQNLELNSAPGAPIDPDTRNTHVEAVNTAVEQLLSGQKVDVSQVVRHNLEFATKTDDEALTPDTYSQGMREAGFEDSADQFDNQTASRLEKLDEVQGKHQQASDELSQAQQNLDNANKEALQNLSPGDKIALVDPETGERLQEIESELGDSGLTNERKSDLLAEQKMLLEGGNWKKKDVSDAVAERNKAAQDKQAEAQKLVDQKQKQVDRYAQELAKRAQKLTGVKGKKAKATAPIEETASDVLPQTSPNREEDIVAQNPDLQIVDEDTGEVKPAAQAMADADAGIAEAGNMKDLFHAAVNCFLGRG